MAGFLEKNEQMMFDGLHSEVLFCVNMTEVQLPKFTRNERVQVLGGASLALPGLDQGARTEDGGLTSCTRWECCLARLWVGKSMMAWVQAWDKIN